MGVALNDAARLSCAPVIKAKSKAKAAHDNQTFCITPWHITLAVRDDRELSILLWTRSFISGGVLPHVASMMLPGDGMKFGGYFRDPRSSEATPVEPGIQINVHRAQNGIA